MDSHLLAMGHPPVATSHKKLTLPPQSAIDCRIASPLGVSRATGAPCSSKLEFSTDKDRTLTQLKYLPHIPLAL